MIASLEGHPTESPPPASAKPPNRGLIVAVIVLAIAALLVAALVVYFRPTVVPDVVLKSADEAAAALEDAGLSVGETSEVATQAVGAGLVANQSPAASSKVPRRSTVDITVAVAPTRSSVPGVTGLDEKSAAEKLDSALYVAQAVDVFDSTAEVGTVIAQVPAAGTEWLTGRPVAIAIAAGPDDGTGVAVPDVRGDSIDGAMSALKEAGLEGYGVVMNPTDAQSSLVTGQLPESGVMVRPGTTVLLLFELP